MQEFWDSYGKFLIPLIAAVALITFMLVSAIFSVWLERKVAGRMQDRLGPTRVGGKFGWLQTIADGLKLIAKEDTIPADADHFLFRIAPYIAFCGAFVAFLALPFGNWAVAKEMNVAVFFMAFTGEPRDHHVYEHAHESPRLMTYPLVILAAFSVFVAWGWPLWKADQSYLGHLLENAQPASVTADFGGMLIAVHERLLPAYHSLAGALALGAALVGVIFAFVIYYLKRFDPADAVEQFPGVYRFLHNKWYFDEFYSAFVVRPSLAVAHWFRWFDSKVIDGILDGSATVTIKTAKGGGRFDNGIIDGLANLIARVVYAVGGWLRNVQTGYLRSYVLFLVLAAIGLFAALTYFVSLAAAR